MLSLLVGINTAIIHFHWITFIGVNFVYECLDKALINKREDWFNDQEMTEKNKTKLKTHDKRSDDTRVKMEGAVSP